LKPPPHTPPPPPVNHPQYFAAVDRLLGNMAAAGFPFSSVRALSGAGQQHGSVYWSTGAKAALAHLDPLAPLATQLAGVVNPARSPIWMDSSTSKQCAVLEGVAGGPAGLAARTGSRAYERFTGSQVGAGAGEGRFRRGRLGWGGVGVEVWVWLWLCVGGWCGCGSGCECGCGWRSGCRCEGVVVSVWVCRGG
jgi:hypothetical protein